MERRLSPPRLFHLMHLAHHTLFKEADRKLVEKLGISSVQMSALFIIKANDGCLMSYLAGAMRMNRSAVTTLAQRLEKAGLVQRMADIEDGRATRLFITGEGKRLVKKGGPEVQKANAELLAGLSAEEARLIETFLLSIIERGSSGKSAPLPAALSSPSA
jgi:DNA-binding MarR family transcriptional regulator